MKTNNTVITFKNKYYVYGLFKPCGTPFYIGKGINRRIDEHFRQCRLKEDNYKNRVIHKIGVSSVKREVLAYFDTEASAYDFEEYLISVYRLKNDGGCLTNVLRSNKDYVKHSPEVNLKKGIPNVKYPENVVVEVYKLYYEDCIRPHQIPKFVDVPSRTVSGIVLGKERKDLYAKYILSGVIVNNLGTKPISPVERLPSVTDGDLVAAYERVCLGTSCLDIAQELNCSVEWLRQVFCGHRKKHLNFNSKRDRKKLPPRRPRIKSTSNKANS
jgi:hypothetical protein